MIKLTDFQVYAITNAIAQWDAENKASENKVLDLGLFKKLFSIRSTIRDTYDAVVASSMPMKDLYSSKSSGEYAIQLLDEKEFGKIVKSVEQYEIFSWITDGLST